jgi:hypothetical protein
MIPDVSRGGCFLIRHVHEGFFLLFEVLVIRVPNYGLVIFAIIITTITIATYDPSGSRV